MTARDVAGNEYTSPPLSFTVLKPHGLDVITGQGTLSVDGLALVPFAVQLGHKDGRPDGRLSIGGDIGSTLNSLEGVEEELFAVSGKKIEWLIINNDFARFQGKRGGDQSPVFHVTIRSGDVPEMEVKIWKYGTMEGEPYRTIRGTLAEGFLLVLGVPDVIRGEVNSSSEFWQQYGIDATSPSGGQLSQTQLEILSLPPTLESIQYPNATHNCTMAPFARTVVRGGMAAYTIALSPSEPARPFQLAFGALPKGVSARFTQASGTSTPLTPVALEVTTSATAPRASLNLMAIYLEEQLDGSTRKSFCQFNLVIE